ncbi:signal recognition particle-docking protein FtsY [Rickettsiales endosymbiont of Peranema trichophorum]|uniref:signal recognition particle-docking protein FtsY n=1 Tax=Rickettsiales endosymbiont of Peranema trichophorum TaxID=2486577 RepID=UPI001022A5AA|nr:signal recognition particle-docking protein FtsY [Rickettsiales endosymbiont of Peranema trichophorum]RZI47488.1 signal recognition particle-docking protein FtsY [Rickettsiales endosymbiont of Peranema trichophorum]
MQLSERLKSGLQKTSLRLLNSINNIFSSTAFDGKALEELEELLIASDIGVESSSEIMATLRGNNSMKGASKEELKLFLVECIATMLQGAANKPMLIDHKPHVVVVCGVNGNGKTTTVAKIAHKFKQNGHSVVIAACDTFRAAAELQLNEWAQRIDCQFVQATGDRSDAASVAYQALKVVQQQNDDVLLIDTAGRLHNKANLMEEFGKILRVLGKIDPSAPHHIVLVLDATTGQNALSQVEFFKRTIESSGHALSGLVITKLDGTAKAGIVVAIAKRFQIPIYFIGCGESLEDLEPFDPHKFAASLFSIV